MKKWLCLLCAVMIAFSCASEAKTKKNSHKQTTQKTQKQEKGNPRHAALVINADTGEVLLQESAYETRYPASLTKMMTLYLTFDAIKAGKLRWGQMLPVSAHAAAQPQTNLSLQKGGSISVQSAVLGLIVRSANDASYVLAEAIGGSSENFASMMTEKARKLGMKNTTFQNPNGLPNSKQVTTAFDMATLGIRLRKDHPEYYNLFKTQQFSFNGRVYKGHNRVLNRLDGVDGIKTGFIGASGFNLVSSIKKDGVNLVGVVMGGRTGSERDNYMVKILKKNYDEQYALLHGGAPTVDIASRKTEEKPVQTASLIERVAAATPRLISDAQADVPTTKPAQPKNAPEQPAPVAAKTSQPGTLDHQMAQLASAAGHVSTTSAAETSKPWGIQIGAYSDKEAAQKAAQKVLGLISKKVTAPEVAITTEGDDRNAIHRARLANLTRKEAKAACQTLQARNAPCFALMVSN